MYPTTLAVIALTFSNYVLQPAFQNCLPPYVATRLLATICICESTSESNMDKDSLIPDILNKGSRLPLKPGMRPLRALMFCVCHMT